jgi:hypothetical protein
VRFGDLPLGRHQSPYLVVKVSAFDYFVLNLTFSCPVGAHFVSLIGLPLEPSYMPAVYSNDQLSDQMSFRQRWTNLFRTVSNHLGFVGGVDETTALFRRRFG